MVFSPRKNPSLCHPNTREREAPTTATSTATATATAVATATAMSVEEKVEEGGESKKEQGEGGAEGAIPAPTKIDKAREQKTGRRKSVRYAFATKRFYLDLKTTKVGSVKIRQLVEDIQLLGGTIDDFFSSEVTTVISDAPEWKLRNPLSGAAVSPGTPRSLAAAANSPWSPATPLDERDKKAARSRVDTILERARQQSKGTSDVIENAHKWGLKVWSLHKILAWLDDLKKSLGNNLKRKSAPGVGETTTAKTLGVHTRSQSVGNLSAASAAAAANLDPPRILAKPYLKFDTNNLPYRPVHCEFKRFPGLNYAGQAGTSPFYSTDSVKGGRGGGGGGGGKGQQHGERPKVVANRRLLRGEDGSKQHHKDPKKKQSRTPTRGSKEQQQPRRQQDKSHHNPKHNHNQHHAKQQAGYCEICEIHFHHGLEDHLASPGHSQVVNVDSYWAKLDRAMSLVNSDSKEETG